jgi:AcrR family transcriptional regulator
MAKAEKSTRDLIVAAAEKLFYAEGIRAVSVDAVAEAAGVTKRTLYYHFDSKDALLTAVLASQHERAFGAFQTYGIDLSGGPEQLIDKLFGGLARWSAKPRWAGSGFTRLAIELADLSGHPARSMAHQHKALMEQQLATLLAKANVAAPRERARELVLLVEGAMVMLLIHGDRDYCTAAVEAAKRLVVDRPAV